MAQIAWIYGFWLAFWAVVQSADWLISRIGPQDVPSEASQKWLTNLILALIGASVTVYVM